MLNVGHLSVNELDLILLTTYALLVLINSRALLPIAELCAYVWIHALPIRNFDAYIICCMIAFFICRININIPSEIRKAFAAFGVVYLLSAADNFLSYHLEIGTAADLVLKPAIVAINAYLLAFLFNDWRRGNACGFINYFAIGLLRCKIYFIHRFKLPRYKA